MGTGEALDLGLIDAHFALDRERFLSHIKTMAEEIATDPAFADRLRSKSRRLAGDLAAKPLAAYRAEELDIMHRNFYGFDSSYHVARYNFVHKIPKSRTPLFLAAHRRKSVTRR
jgi:putative two-component system hydrogenase maturation factor HypX/HoxX